MSEGLGLRRTRVFDGADRDFTLPDLTTVSGVAMVTDPVESDIAATYFDTTDLRLAARHITVRRTASGDSATWDLRIPGEDGSASEVRTEHPGSEPTVPTELTELIRGSVRDKDLGPVASVRTVRVERRLLDADDHELALVIDDQIHGLRLTAGSAELTQWRRLAVELLGGDHGLLDAVSSSLQEAGLVHTSTPRLHRALGRDVVPIVDLREPAGDGTAGALIATRLGEGVVLLVGQDWALRGDRPDAVHAMRVAVRRLRCDLATWRPFLDRERTDPVRSELRWLGRLLGHLCDSKMLESRLVGTVRGLPADMVIGPVVERIERELLDRRAAGAEGLATAIEGVRYFALLDALEALAEDPPLAAPAADAAEEAMAARVAQAVARFDRAAAALDVPSTPEGHSDRLHEARKAARRVRYAAEATEPQLGRRARRLADSMTGLQDLLGEHRHSVVARQALQDISEAAHVAGESAFTYGILHGIERDRGEVAEQAFEAARRALGPSKAHRWAST